MPRINQLMFVGLATVLTVTAVMPVSAAPAKRSSPGRTPIEDVRALNGAMPRSFDLNVDDPCSGAWDLHVPDGRIAMKITVFRYRGRPLMHISGDGFGPSNNRFIRVDPHSVKLAASGTTGIALRCSDDRGVAEIKVPGRSSPLILTATPGLPDIAGAPPRPLPPEHQAQSWWAAVSACKAATSSMQARTKAPGG